jgi:hypothetical protein
MTILTVFTKSDSCLIPRPFFEVKTSTTGTIGNLAPKQQNMDQYVRGILMEASEGQLRGPVTAADKALAKKLLSVYRADPSQVSGTVVGVDLNNQIHVQPWPGRPTGN